MLTTKTWKREEQLLIKCPKTKVCNLKERRNNEIPGSNIGKSLKKPKLDERVSLKKESKITSIFAIHILMIFFFILGQVREVRTETKRYGGEHSGINMRVKKGIKLS